ncbi:MAG: GFA family protein [Propylenella sp.]
MQRPHALSCHCGAIRFEVDAELADLVECNCSTCARHSFLHWKVPVEAVRLVTQNVRISTYLWRDAAGGHHFCPVCGTAMMRTGYQTGVSLNARCIEGVDIFELKTRRYDGLREIP